jgi:hypothetical protein
MTQLRALPWFECKQEDLHWFCAAAARDILAGYTKCPPGWSKPPRKQLDPLTRDQRYTITWDIPAAELEAAFTETITRRLHSTPLYAAGSGLGLGLYVRAPEDGQPRKIGVNIHVSTFDRQGATVVPMCGDVQVTFVLRHHMPDPPGLQIIKDTSATLHMYTGWGHSEYYKASSMADLQPHLSDGYLKLSATFKIIH